MKHAYTFVWSLAAVLLLSQAEALGQTPLGTAVTYQGQLKLLGEPVNGVVDFEFTLWDADIGGTQVAGPVVLSSTPVNEGLFTVVLDFGADVFSGDARWLEIVVDGRTLSPRQSLTTTPYAIYALNGGGSSAWEVAGSDIYHEAGNVGIGTTAPLWPLHVESTTLYSVYARNWTTTGPAYAGFFRSDSDGGYGVIGYASAAAGGNVGVFGKTDGTSSNAYGVYGRALATSGEGRGVYGRTDGDGGTGVYGHAVSPTGMTFGITGLTLSDGGYGVYGRAAAASGQTFGVYGSVDSPEGQGVWGHASSATGTTLGVRGTVTSPDGYAGYFTGGRNYFQNNVGIGELNPQAKLHIGGTPDVDGIMFPDGTLQTTAATGVAGLWTPDANDIYYDAGNVGVGTSSPTHPLDVRSAEATTLYARNTASGFAVNAYSNGTAIVASSDAYSGSAKGVSATTFSPDGFALYGVNEAEEGVACGVYGESGSIDGIAVYGRVPYLQSSGSPIAVFGEMGESGGQAIYGEATHAFGVNYAVRGHTNSSNGYAGYFTGGKNYFEGKVGIGTDSPASKLHVINPSSDAITGACTGEGTRGTLGHEWAGVVGENDYPDGFAGMFYGRGYFSDYVGIGVDDPQTTLHLGGVGGYDGIIFPDGTLQVSAAVGGSGDSLWSDADGDIYYTAGNVGIGTSSPTESLHVADDAQIDGILGVGTAPSVYAALDVQSDANYFGIRVQRTAAVDGAAITGTATATSGSADGVRGSTNAPDGSGIYGFGETGVEGYCNTETGIGVVGKHSADSGDAPGVYGTTNSTTSLASGVKGEATATSGAETVGVMGLSHSVLGAGVYGIADHATGMSIGGRFESTSPSGIGVHSTATGVNSFAGYFAGRSYFGDNVGIGTSSPEELLHVAGTARVTVLEIAGGSDLAENFSVTEPDAQPGTVVEIDPDNPGRLRVARGAYNRRVAGVISGANKLGVGMVLADLPGAENSLPIALSGRVWVRCDATQRAIEPGDLLTTAERPGHAMPVLDFDRANGAVIGKAMSKLAQGETGMVLILVNLQ